ncbi:MAG: ATP-binding protein, partial [Salinimicrobium sediminis]|nr:ATP-binding protein [Salinimicrobium sediminis]
EKSLVRSKELAEKLNIQKDNFIANMSHEIRTPIHAILGFTGLLLEQEEEAGKRNYLESVKTAGDNLLFIINDILDLSKIEAGIIQLDKEPFDLLLTIDKVFSILHLKAHQKKISFKYVVHPKVKCNLVGDKNRLTQILINLLGNAIKFTSSGSVELFIEPKDLQQNITTLKFKIVDTGIGIPEAKRESIFDRFSQADEDTSRNYGGTGLGLNISQQLIHRQGGSIWVESEEGKGSTFIFELPFQISSLKLQPIIEKSTPVLSVKKEGRILLCEDNELNQKLIKAILLEKGYEIDLAENGLKGIDLFQSNKYDIVLMDIQMPIMDGFATTKKIRQEIKSQVPIVALTANSLIVEKTKCLQLGMNDYLPKPFTKEDILTKVDQWINNLPADKSSEVRKNILVQDFLSFEVLEELSGGDKEFEKEMKILFLQQTEKVLEELKQASEFKDLDRIKAAAHKLKSSFGIFGINPGLLNALEDFSQEDFVHSGVDQNLILLEERLKNIFRILNETLNPPINGNPTC